MEPKNTQEVANRGFNLLAVSIAGLAGFAFLPEAFMETDVSDKLDDILLFVVALIGIAWYTRGNNRYKRSVVPVVLNVVALAIKISGVIIERGDAASVGDDFGGLILFVLATSLVLYQYFRSNQLSKVQSA